MGVGVGVGAGVGVAVGVGVIGAIAVAVGVGVIGAIAVAVGGEEKFNRSMGKTITTGKLDPNLEQSGKDYVSDLRGELNKAQRSRPKVNQVQDRANK